MSPADAPADSAVAFRAGGTAPRWSAEVGEGDAPRLRVAIEGGARIEIAHAVGISSTPGFGGRSDDGTDVVLRILDAPCDAGDTVARGHRSTLQVGDRTYRGCGAWRDE